MCSKIAIKLRQCIIKIKSHIMSIVKVQSITPVHSRVVDVIRQRRGITGDCCLRYSQTWRKSFPWSGDVHHGKPSIDEEGSAPQTQQLDRLWNAALEWAQDRKALSWGSSGRLRISESAEVGSHRLSGPSCPEGSWTSPQDESLLLNDKMRGFLASEWDEFNLGPETRLNRSELLCNKVLLKYKGDRESFWHRHQKGAERIPRD